jgi:hypothetical protein
MELSKADAVTAENRKGTRMRKFDFPTSSLGAAPEDSVGLNKKVRQLEVERLVLLDALNRLKRDNQRMIDVCDDLSLFFMEFCKEIPESEISVSTLRRQQTRHESA